MRDGIYEVVFTTTTGTLGQGACVFQNGRVAGADFLHSYVGAVVSDPNALRIEMHCRRQPGIETSITLPQEFSLTWGGDETALGFALKSTLPGEMGEVVAIGLRLTRGVA